ncbi:hypothetical protein ACFQUU_28380 [Herbaspirillum sp. GCM10030257]|uniref:hypothetical protein n=1 Tax=Herbaspirillum sp. GCM10030257 TaxID=3273393 RepID=UPI00360627DB
MMTSVEEKNHGLHTIQAVAPVAPAASIAIASAIAAITSIAVASNGYWRSANECHNSSLVMVIHSGIQIE